MKLLKNRITTTADGAEILYIFIEILCIGSASLTGEVMPEVKGSNR
ncbi:MAG: hypothetical protein K2J08_05725 [Ruminococcus sp.]|nr:hypothetical protein [Ruminococcus sp.]